MTGSSGVVRTHGGRPVPGRHDRDPFGHSSRATPGPATGLPTRTEQGELLFALHAGHGEFPRVIFAPGTAEQAVYLTNKAFDLAEKYQIPAFVLTDQYLADRHGRTRPSISER